jgi:hypothetical protein
MNSDIQQFLSNLAGCGGLTITSPEGSPISISGYPDGEPRFVIADQPDSELIFAILKNIGLVAPVTQEPRIPWYLNRPYEIEPVGEFAYKTRRALRQKFNSQWQAGFWALYVYSLLPCQNEFLHFLKQHPRKLILMPVVLLTTLKFRLSRTFQRP